MPKTKKKLVKQKGGKHVSSFVTQSPRAMHRAWESQMRDCKVNLSDYSRGRLLGTVGADPVADNLLSYKGVMRGALGAKEFVIELGGYSALTTTAATLLTYSTYGATSVYQTIPMSVSTSGVNWSAEYTAILSASALWDEFKMESITFHYEPYNPYNRGNTTNSDPIALVYDDENVLASTGSISTMNTYSNRGPGEFVPFSLDHTFRHTFRRPSSLKDYAWSNNTPDTTSVNGLNGSVALAYDNTALSLSTRYGTMFWTFKLHVRFRI